MDFDLEQPSATRTLPKWMGRWPGFTEKWNLRKVPVTGSQTVNHQTNQSMDTAVETCNDHSNHRDSQ